MLTEIQTPLGHSLPPEGPHTITFHVPKWESALRFREGDASLIARLKSAYPRFFPFGPSALLIKAIGQQIKLAEGRSIVAFLSPGVWLSSRDHAISGFLKDKALTEDELKYHVVEIDGIRLYLFEFPAAKTMGAIFMWQHGGLGFGTRLGEYLLPKVETLRYYGEFPGGSAAPTPTYLPEVESHDLLRKRISGLLMRATVEEYAKPVQPDDIYLYQSGMAAITKTYEVINELRPEPVAVFGALFNSSWRVFEESPGGLKHYGKCDENDFNEFEKYLEGGGKCSYVFTEFPSNPILVSADLIRLRKLAEKYGFWVVVDDTVAGFCNLDVLSVADVLITSLTKAFSGYADVLAGCIALNPNKASYNTLKPCFAENFRNEFFAGDADQLLKNSNDYLPRAAILNRNAATMASYFQSLAEDPKAPVAKACYPPYADGSKHLLPFLRKPTPEVPKPGYGCLFSVELATTDQVVEFYDNLQFHCGPHLGAHLTLVMPYNAITFGKDNPDYHAGYGMSPNQIRFSAGLEDEPYLLEVCKNAIAAVSKAGTQAKEGGDLAGEMLGKVEENIEQKTELDPMGGKST
ncbi:cystathionine gamma-synthase [Xylariales sp. AK1849]|nr:cystathionine gamma-synthase [Xylariales sp. AK1849]